MSFESDLDKLVRSVDGVIPGALLAGGLVLEGQMKQNIVAAPWVDTGETLNSTQARPSGDEVHVGPTTQQAIYGEFGTVRGIPAHAYARKAYDSHKSKAQQAFAAYIKERLG